MTVAIYGDKQKEADESFYLVPSGASSNASISNGWGYGRILNDDSSPGGGRKK